MLAAIPDGLRHGLLALNRMRKRAF
jgi:hypothetical protein